MNNKKKGTNETTKKIIEFYSKKKSKMNEKIFEKT